VLSKEYREYADECLAWAKTAGSDKERRSFLQMAETWLRAAVQAEQSERRQSVNDDGKQASDVGA
jgi:hypothetical protein